MVSATRSSKVKVYFHHHHSSASVCACTENFLVRSQLEAAEESSGESSQGICRNKGGDVSVNDHVHVFCMHEINPCRFTVISIHNCQLPSSADKKENLFSFRSGWKQPRGFEHERFETSDNSMIPYNLVSAWSLLKLRMSTMEGDKLIQSQRVLLRRLQSSTFTNYISLAANICWITEHLFKASERNSMQFGKFLLISWLLIYSQSLNLTKQTFTSAINDIVSNDIIEHSKRS